MTILNEKDSLVMVIDIQEKLLNAVYNKPIIKKNSEIITKTCSILNIPLIITEQYPKGLGSTVESIKSILPDNTNFIEKTAFSALDNPEVLNKIKEFNKKQIIVFGIETHICVSQTINVLTNKGFETILISDCSGSRKEIEHLAGIERIKEYGASVITTEITLFEWLKTSKHPKFKEVQSLIK